MRWPNVQQERALKERLHQDYQLTPEEVDDLISEHEWNLTNPGGYVEEADPWKPDNLVGRWVTITRGHNGDDMNPQRAKILEVRPDMVVLQNEGSTVKGGLDKTRFIDWWKKGWIIPDPKGVHPEQQILPVDPEPQPATDDFFGDQSDVVHEIIPPATTLPGMTVPEHLWNQVVPEATIPAQIAEPVPAGQIPDPEGVARPTRYYVSEVVNGFTVFDRNNPGVALATRPTRQEAQQEANRLTMQNWVIHPRQGGWHLIDYPSWTLTTSTES
jgi:hypothetical protein